MYVWATLANRTWKSNKGARPRSLSVEYCKATKLSCMIDGFAIYSSPCTLNLAFRDTSSVFLSSNAIITRTFDIIWLAGISWKHTVFHGLVCNWHSFFFFVELSKWFVGRSCGALYSVISVSWTGRNLNLELLSRNLDKMVSPRMNWVFFG